LEVIKPLGKKLRSDRKTGVLLGKYNIIDYTVFMNILIISNLYPPYVLGGYEILCGQVVQYLKERQHTLHILTSDHGVGSENRTNGEDSVSRSLRLYLPFGEKAAFLRKARVKTARFDKQITKEVIEQYRPDVIFIWSILRLTPGSAKAAEDSGIPVVYTFNDENIAGFLPAKRSFFPKAFIRWGFDTFITSGITLRGLKFTHTTCISKIVKRNLINRGLRIDNSHVIYQGIPIEHFPQKDSAGFMERPVRILYAGQLHFYKGVHTIIEALVKLKESAKEIIPEFCLTIAGKGADKDPYTDNLKSQAVQGKIPTDFLGIVPHHEMSGVYQKHDIFVFPSIWEEPFGLTHIEAMASGLPVVSTANGGQGEFLKADENALVFPPGDADALAGCLERLMTDADLFKRLARQGRDTAVREFTFSRYVDELENLLHLAEGTSAEAVEPIIN
jgi:glycogen synthase